MGCLLQKRKYFPAFLNLLVIPGSGTLVLAQECYGADNQGQGQGQGHWHRINGFLQLGLSFFSLGLLAMAFSSSISWVFTMFVEYNRNYDFSPDSTSGHADFMDYLVTMIEFGNYPVCFGFSVVPFFVSSFVIFSVAWIFSLISLFQGVKTKETL